MATPLVGNPGEAVRQSAPGLEFYKMSGSGNDFVVVDGRQPGAERVIDPAVVRRLCERRTGVGSDGVILLAPEVGASFRMIYLNSDGSRAAMCGNAALCSTRLAAEIGLADAAGMEFLTDSGPVQARLERGLPEIDLAPIREVRPELDLSPHEGERRLGYVLAGVPHVVVCSDDVENVDVRGRGGELRRHPMFPEGTNVDFVSPARGRSAWSMRTFERGVEAETLACGTGAVASALLLTTWGMAGEETRILTRSGLVLRVRLRRRGNDWLPSLSGEGRIVFQGQLRDV